MRLLKSATENLIVGFATTEEQANELVEWARRERPGHRLAVQFTASIAFPKSENPVSGVRFQGSQNWIMTAS